MRRIFLITLALFVIFIIAAAAVSALPTDRNIANIPQPVNCPPNIDCLDTPTPPPGGNTSHPGDPDGDGIPNGIDLCPDEGGPSSNSGCPPGRILSASSPQVSLTTPDIPALLLPILPATGNCVLATRTSEGVNVRNQPSIHSAIVGTLDPAVPYLVISILHDSEGTWYRVIPGWVAGRVVRLGGNCKTLPVIEEPGAADSKPITFAYPDGFRLALDKGDAPGADTPQGYCSSDFAIHWPTFDGSDTDAVHFDFGDVSRCIKLNTDGHGFVLSPPDPCSPEPTCFNVAWFIGFNLDHQPLLVGLFAPPSEGDPPDPDKTDVLLSWVFPPSTSTSDFTIRWALGNPPEPDKPGLTINWALGNPPEPDKPGLTINWALSDPPDPDKPGLTINWALTDPPDPDKPSITINEGLSDPPDPDFQGFGIDGIPGVAAQVKLNFILPAVQ